MGKSIETESRLVVASGWGGGRGLGLMVKGRRVSLEVLQ